MQDEVLLRTSERTQFKRCRWAWDRAYNDHIKPTDTSPALYFGDLVHRSLEKYYRPGLKRGPHPAKTFLRLYDREGATGLGFRDADSEEWTDAREMGKEVLVHYVDHWGKDDRYKVIATEQPFQLPVYDAEGNYRVTYVGTVDGIWQDTNNGAMYIVDHKTCKTIDTAYLFMDEQASAYWTFGLDWLYVKGILKKRQKLSGLLFNFIRKAKPDQRPKNAEGQHLNQPTKENLTAYFEREGLTLPAKKTKDALAEQLTEWGVDVTLLGDVSKSQPPAYFHREPVLRDDFDRERVRERVLQEVEDMERVRSGESAAYKTPGSPPNTHCKFCGFRDICELHETGADWEGMRDMTMSDWEPYSAHEIQIAR